MLGKNVSSSDKKRKEIKERFTSHCDHPLVDRSKQCLAAFAASIADFGALQHQISRIEWTN
jgi:hypothetical protein